MKKGLLFIAGVITGIILTIIVLVVIADNTSDKGLTLFEKEGECVSDKSFEVFQVLNDGNALASEYEGFSIATGITVLFLAEKGTSYYDDQVIKIPEGKCAKQIGVYKYITNAGIEKTVPIVEILDK